MHKNQFSDLLQQPSTQAQEPSTQAQEPSSQVQAQKPLNVEIHRLYVKEQSCKVPHGNQAFQVNGKSEAHTEMNINSQPLSKESYEITLHITLTNRVEQRTIYQVDVHQAAIIKTDCAEETPLSNLMNIGIPTILYPYARKVIADAVYNAGFPPVFLPHVDFGNMYQQRETGGTKTSQTATNRAKEEETIQG